MDDGPNSGLEAKGELVGKRHKSQFHWLRDPAPKFGRCRIFALVRRVAKPDVLFFVNNVYKHENVMRYERMAVMRRRCSVSVFLVAVFMFCFANVAQAQTRVQVGMVDYDIFVNTGSFNSVNSGGALINTATAPWFGNAALAGQFRDAFVTANDTAAIGSSDVLMFAYAALIGSAFSEAAVNTTGTNVTSDGAQSPLGTDTLDGALRTISYATATLVAVPEINGSALAQMLLVLSVGYLMLLGRRRLRQS